MQVLLRNRLLEIAENMTWLGQFKYQWYVKRLTQKVSFFVYKDSI